MQELPRVVIPTYERYLTIGNNTLRYLESIKYPREKILVFVANEEQQQLYTDWLEEHQYGKIIVGELGLNNQRNFITKYLEQDEVFISFDDDVQKIKMLPGHTFYTMLYEACDKIREGIVGLAGCMPNSDGRRFKNNYTLHLSHILGAFYICKNDRAKQLVSIPGVCEGKEDYFRTLQYFLAFGNILRFQYAGVQTIYRNPEGGIEPTGRRDRDEIACQYLVTTYPNLCKRIRKKSGFPDILLKWYAKK